MAYLHANTGLLGNKAKYLRHQHRASIANQLEMDWKWSKS
jgi:hypothetical protein